jgi:hypothetical protein
MPISGMSDMFMKSSTKSINDWCAPLVFKGGFGLVVTMLVCVRRCCLGGWEIENVCLELS